MNRKQQDNTSKLIFDNHVLCAQFLRDYMDIPMLKNVKPEDIEDVTERFLPIFMEERDADTVKKSRYRNQSHFFSFLLLNIRRKWIIM